MEATAPYHGESLDPIVQGHRSRIYSYDRVATSKIVEWCCYLFIPVVTSLWANSERWCMQRSENYDRELTLFIKATVRLSVDLDHWSHSFLMMFLPIRDSANFWTRVNSVMYVVKKKIGEIIRFGNVWSELSKRTLVDLLTPRMGITK